MKRRKTSNKNKHKKRNVILLSLVGFMILLGIFYFGILQIMFSGNFHSFNPDFQKNLTFDSESVLIKSTKNIDTSTYVGSGPVDGWGGWDGGEIYDPYGNIYTYETLPTNTNPAQGDKFSLTQYDQIEYFDGSSMGMELNTKAKSLASSVHSGQIETIILTNKHYDFNNIKTLSFDYEIYEKYDGSLRTSLNGAIQGGNAKTYVVMGLTNSKRNIIAIQDESTFYVIKDNSLVASSVEPKLLLGTYTFNSETMDIPTDLSYEFFVYGNIDGGYFSSSGVNSNLKVEITSINIIEKDDSTDSIADETSDTTDTTNTESNNGDVIIEQNSNTNLYIIGGIILLLIIVLVVILIKRK